MEWINFSFILSISGGVWTPNPQPLATPVVEQNIFFNKNAVSDVWEPHNNMLQSRTYYIISIIDIRSKNNNNVLIRKYFVYCNMQHITHIKQFCRIEFDMCIWIICDSHLHKPLQNYIYKKGLSPKFYLRDGRAHWITSFVGLNFKLG